MTNLLHVKGAADNFRQCEQYTRHFAKTFYFASYVLPKEKRMASYAVYAFCRYADEIADSAYTMNDPSGVSRRLAALRDQVSHVYTHSAKMSPALRAFQATVFRYDIPQAYVLDLLRGVEMDLTKTRYDNFAELEGYCYCVASVVGLMMTRILGVSNDSAMDHAADLGTAMQLTNILRDVGEDYRRGRIYLPAAELQRFSCDERDIRRGVVNDAVARFLAFQIQRARTYYERAEAGIPMITNDGSRLCVKLMSRTYATILDAIEANGYDVFTRRARVPWVSKVNIALRAALSSDPPIAQTSVGVQAERVMHGIPSE